MEDFIFSVDSALLGELGERLVPSVHIALTELVKNSYDADANEVSISIEEKDSMPVIEIKDDGVGMTLEEVQAYWMKIGTTNKVKQPVSRRYGRPRTGAKGIGRFCCRRLGDHLELETCAEIPEETLTKEDKKAGYKFEVTKVFFDWNDFIPGKDVSTVKSKGESKRKSIGKTGTILRLYGARQNEWRQRGFDFLRRQLSTLASNQGAKRKGFIEDKGFAVFLHAPGFSGGVGDLRNQVIDAGWGTLTGEVDSSGKASYVLEAKRIGKKTIVSRKKYKYLRNVKIKFGIIPIDKNDLRDTGVLSKGGVLAIVNEWGGIQVRYNGFRIYPYGESEDDWLNIEKDRARRLAKPDNGQLFEFAASFSGADPSRSLLSLLSGKNFLGVVETGSECKMLEAKLDRQGFNVNEAFNELREFVRFSIDWSTIYRDHYVRLKTSDQAAVEREKYEQEIAGKKIDTEKVPQAAFRYLKKEIERISSYLPQGEKEVTEQKLLQTTRTLEAISTESQHKLQHLRLIASASTLTVLFTHEIRSFLATLDAISEELRRMTKWVPAKEKNKLELLQSEVSNAHGRFNDLVSLTNSVAISNANDNAVRLNLYKSIEAATKCFNLITRKYDIDIDYWTSVDKGVTVGPILQSELMSILINVISNAVKAVIAGGDSRSILFRTDLQKDKVILEVLDSGVGLEPEYYEEVFSTFVSDPTGEMYTKLDSNVNPEDKIVLGQGTGLGLSIVKDILESRKGSISFVAPDSGWETKLLLRFPTKN